jgi:CheY-like chemotaxis protein
MTKILWVDDEDKVRRVTQRVLESVGYEVDAVKTSEEAITLFEREPFGYEVILTDLTLKGSALDGEQLMEVIFERRDERGYDPAPHIICVTGQPDRQNSATVQRVEEKGGRYVTKGHPNVYLPLIEREVNRIEQLRHQGPTFMVIHALSGKVGTSVIKSGTICPTGEAVTKILLSVSTEEVDLKLSPTEKLVFDYLARMTQRYPLSLSEVTQGLSENRFYSLWFADGGPSKENVKKVINTVRNKLMKALTLAKIGLKADDILVSEDISSEDADSDEKISAPHNGKKKRPTDKKKNLKQVQYQLRGRFIVRHQP